MKPAGTARIAAIFRALLGLVFVCAFASALVQADGLIGSKGIEPLHDLLLAAKAQLGWRAWFEIPTLFWVDSSDAAIHALLWMGILGGVVLAAGIAPKPCVAFLWAAYLSVVSTGDVFFGYQWDALLLETAFFSFFLFPAWPLPARDRDVPSPGWFGVRFTLFKVMSLSGVVKLASGDPHWRSLDALEFHWWTQPLPAWTAWYAARLPHVLQLAATLSMLVIELVVPLMLFLPRAIRRWAFPPLVLLQIGIAATGNYGFFNLLSFALCFSALDDGVLAWFGITAPVLEPDTNAKKLFRRADGLALFGLLLFLPLSALAGFSPRSLPHAIGSFDTFNPYGLFAVMTTERREIDLEGSADGVEWKHYRFHWKPDDLSARPRFIGPHMPRLDWQMWFAGLGSCRREPWLLHLQQKLLTGHTSAAGLFAENPFPDSPPKFLRTPSWQYRFSDSGSGWWRRDADEPFCPTLTLDESGELHRAD